MSNMWQKEVTWPTLLLPLLIIIIMPLFFFFSEPQNQNKTQKNDDITQHLYDYYETSSSSLTVDTYDREKLRSMANERWMIEPNILYTLW
jgi:uncharacterized membrane protein affecting hemolysin expression